MAHLAGEAETGDLRVDFDRRLRLEFHVCASSHRILSAPLNSMTRRANILEMNGDSYRLASSRKHQKQARDTAQENPP